MTNRYDVVIAAAFEESETDGRNFPFYDLIKEELKKRGYSTFIPNRELQSLSDPLPIIVKAIRNSRIVLADLGIPSTAPGMMEGSAFRQRKPVIYFQDTEDPYRDDDVYTETHVHQEERLRFTGKADGLKKIVDAVCGLFGMAKLD